MPAMNLSDPVQRRIFFEVHRDLPREAPGSTASTAQALDLAGDAAHAMAVLDVACGPGMQTLALADRLPLAQIIAVDLYGPYLGEVRRRAAGAGSGPRIHPVCADMAHLPFARGSFDLVWCEGGVYLLGVESALQAWRELLRPGGRIAFTDAVWLRDGAPAAVRSFWQEYPGMQDVAGVRAAIRRAGLETVGDFVLPERDWWDSYYSPMERRIESIRQRCPDDAVATGVLDECQAEIDLYRRYAEWYGYAFFIASV